MIEVATMPGNTPPLKQQAHEMIDNLPESATWDDVAYEAELRASIEHGLGDAEAGRILTVDDLMEEFGVEPPASLPPAL
jgi:predicted transcriptional regulator